MTSAILVNFLTPSATPLLRRLFNNPELNIKNGSLTMTVDQFVRVVNNSELRELIDFTTFEAHGNMYRSPNPTHELRIELEPDSNDVSELIQDLSSWIGHRYQIETTLRRQEVLNLRGSEAEIRELSWMLLQEYEIDHDFVVVVVNTL